MTAELNDTLRKQIPSILPPNKLVLTNGIAGLTPGTVGAILHDVKDFDDFTPDNDPYGEHDFGSLIFPGSSRKIFWKIDDYEGQENLNLVLTIMFSDEY